ncbi:MAG: glycerol-3-phosphate acyltransferase [Actinomycetota bacterium]
MNGGRVLWLVGAYAAGTVPSALLVARAKRATALLAASGRRAGETDAHILMAQHLGVGWTVVAATLDVLKGFVVLLAGREWGDLPPAWLALVGVAAVLGHTFPLYGREMAGRGLATASGVYLILLPFEMVVAGVTIVVGRIVRTTGLATTGAMAAVPILAAAQGQPGELIAMSVAIFGILMIRRLEGVGDVVRSGIPTARAVLYRCVFDSSGPPASETPSAAREDLPGA